MSIPFWIAATLLYVIPDMKRMTTYDDPKIAEMIRRIKLISCKNWYSISRTVSDNGASRQHG